ncbi:hypothetical protein [Sphingomonas sp. Leaf30]|uniref:hypothetical protein n=1 Tax=Sphingomonas sp. Leaf30 TaxID=1736213 RepID=UPI0006FCC395|nr:hypothetical protein [Sphingomonas sp. Leaf30]KQN16489.1 hypothetical protein ASE89_07635 [Sphingomonas sp. Leaf30]
MKKKEDDMQVALFRALRSANIDDEAAAKAVVVVEEQIDMAVGRAIEPLKQQIAGLEVKLESGLKGMQTSIDGLKWYIIGLGSLMTGAIAIGAALTAYAQFIK